MKNIYRFLLCFMAFASAYLAANAKTIEFSYANIDANREYMGTGEAETYDVAIRLSGEEFGDCKVTAIKVPVELGDDEVSDIKFWLSSSLSTGTFGSVSKNVADILTIKGKRDGDMAYVNLPEKIDVTKEGVYVGYTFTIKGNNLTERQKYPVTTMVGGVGDALYFHTSATTPSWNSYALSRNASSALTVTLEGDFKEASASIVLPEEINIASSDNLFNVPVKIKGFCTDPISYLIFNYSSPSGLSGSAELKFNPSLDLQYGKETTVELQLEGDLSLGENILAITLEDINGLGNACGPEASGTMIVYGVDHIPTHRPLMEEFTGLNCGWCPRGYAAMEYMEKKYPGEFIGVAYHCDDILTFLSRDERPIDTPSIPTSYFDRAYKVDPYFGYQTSGFGLEDAWIAHSRMFVPMDINVEATWQDENNSMVDVKTELEFVKEIQETYSIEYILLTDGIHDLRFMQHNYFVGQEGYDDIPEMWRFTHGESIITDLLYNGLAVARIMTDDKIEGEDISVSNKVIIPFSVDLQPYKDNCIVPVFADHDMVKIVALIKDSDGNVVNSAICKVSDNASLSDVEELQSENVRYYNLSGQIVDDSACGFMIRVVTFPDGKTKTCKVIRH